MADKTVTSKTLSIELTLVRLKKQKLLIQEEEGQENLEALP